MTVQPSERRLLRDLARQVAEIAAHPRQNDSRQMWYRHNRLEKVKNIVLVYPEGAWNELLPADSLVTTTEQARGYEWHLRSILYRWDHLRDDNVIEPTLNVYLTTHYTGWGPEVKYIHSSEQRGAWRYDPPIKAPDDADQLRPPALTVDEAKTRGAFDAANDLFGDILHVRLKKLTRINTSLIGELCALRGLDQVMIDMIDRPDWLHRVMTFMTDSVEALMDQLEADGWLCLNNRDDYNCSGGVGYTDELPTEGFDGEHVRWADLWGFADAQEVTAISPAMHEEFVLHYQRRLLSRFGLNTYGCCEPLHDRWDIVHQIPRLRRVSVSPWCDVASAAEALRDRIIFSWKPDPAMLVGHFDEDRVRSYLKHTLDIAGDCIFEMILKDTHTVEGEPERMHRWVQIAQELTSGC